MGYDANSIIELTGVEHIRATPGMYIGSTENPTSLLFELFDNAVDEALAGYASNIGIFIDNKNGIIRVFDDGRGYPFDENLPIADDPPVLTCTRLFTSGKFKKQTDDSAYKISTGLHGVGNVAVYAMSEWMKIEIFRDGKRAIYKFADKDITREVIPYTEKSKVSTVITVKVDQKYFTDFKIDCKRVEERARLVVANHPNLKIIMKVNDKDIVIKGSEDDLIMDYLSKHIQTWFSIDDKNVKSGENYHIRIGWEPDKYTPPKTLSCVNLVRTEGGVHINKLYNTLRSIFQDLSKKYKRSFNLDDCFQGLRVYLSLEIIKTSFEAQVKTTLEKNADISIMDSLEKKLKTALENDKDELEDLLDKFQSYRSALNSKSTKSSGRSTRRSFTKFTKLRDCSELGGELIIGEGDSAIGGVAEHRNIKKHAVLPLRGVIPNALTMDHQKLLKNVEVSEIIQAIGTGIGNDCDITKLRYSKIIIATDSDPAGHFIASLLIILFAKLAPEVIKHKHLFVCKTPLYGVKRDKKFVPLWDKKSLDEAKEKNEKIKRYKGLGEFEPEDLKTFILDEGTRILIPVSWTTDEKLKNLFELFTNASKKKELVSGTWDVNN